MKVRAVDPQYLSSLPYYARHGQDRFLDEEVFHHKKNGVFVDIGAYDGVQSSNTLFFEESLNWTGVCVEPLPHAFEKLRANRDCICVNACASDRYARARFLHVVPDKQQRSPGQDRIPNYEKMSGLQEFFTQEHEQRIREVLEQVGGYSEAVDVPCVPIDSILELAASPHIDCLSIDTEGSEFHILQSMDVSRFDIDVIVVEVLYANAEFEAFMNSLNFARIAQIGYDWIYRNRRAGR
jgi:FkbM family methyltransferase